MSIITNINKLFDHRIRLGIMSILMVNEHADFNSLKELLGATDGNLASHTKALEKVEYIKVEKSKMCCKIKAVQNPTFQFLFCAPYPTPDFPG